VKGNAKDKAKDEVEDKEASGLVGDSKCGVARHEGPLHHTSGEYQRHCSLQGRVRSLFGPKFKQLSAPG
jgi:hypothetical protein